MGTFFLGILYHQLHEVAYWKAQSIGCGTTLLMIWAWEHVAIIQPPIQRPQLTDGMPYVYYYVDALQQTRVGVTGWWWHCIDTMMSFIWRSYKDCGQWEGEDDHLSFFQQFRYLIGRIVQSQLIIEMYLSQRVLRQFGEQQGVLIGMTKYARSSRESAWGPPILVEFFEQQIDGLVAQQWGWQGRVADLGMKVDYDLWWQAHQPIPLTNLDGPVSIDRRSIIPCVS